MKKLLYITSLFCLGCLYAHAQLIPWRNPVILYDFAPKSIVVSDNGEDVYFGVATDDQKGYSGYYEKTIDFMGRVVFKGSQYSNYFIDKVIIDTAIHISPGPVLQAASGSIYIPDNIRPVQRIADLDYICVEDSGSRVESVFFDPVGSGRTPDKLNVIRFKPNLTKETFKGVVNFIFLDEGDKKTLLRYSIAYTQLPQPDIQPGRIAEYVESSPLVARVIIQILEPFKRGDTLLTPQWESCESGVWKSIVPMSQNSTTAVFFGGESRMLRCKVGSGDDMVYSNICTVLTKSTMPDENYVRKFNFNGAATTENVEYYDGLGGLSQTIQVAASPTNKSIVSPQWYDILRRADTRTYLPYVAASGSSTPAADPFSEQEAYYRGIYGNGEVRNFVETVYETSPLNRPLSRQMPGKVFEDSGKKAVYKYSFNKSNEVFQVQYDEETGNILAGGGTYPANTLFCSEVTDEDGTKKTTYYNLQQQKVLERTDAAVNTYYVYNDLGLLCWVIQPEGSAMLPSFDPITPDSDIARKYCFRYRYDGRGRQIERQQPGRDVEYSVYNRNNEVIMTQNGDQYNKGIWQLDELDRFGRLICRRLIACTEHRASLQELFDSGLEWQLYSAVPVQILQANTYGSAGNSELFPFVPVPGVVTAADVDNRTHGLLTASESCVLGQEGLENVSTQTGQYHYYDYKGRIIQTVGSNHTGGISRVSYAYDFAGNLVARHEAHQFRSSLRADSMLTRYTYDHQGRLLLERASVNGSTAATVAYSYDELGRLSSKKYGTSTPTTENYTYNLQGWETGRDNELFSMRLRYYDPKYGDTKASFVGNITEWEWRHIGDGATGDTHTYAYHYDSQHRLQGYSQYMNNDLYDHNVEQELVYDTNGNLKAMLRTGSDNSLFSYGYNGNLLSVLNCDGIDCHYEYDANGNCTKDGLNNLDIQYNSLNLPLSVCRSEVLQGAYAYSVSGEKLAVRTENGYGYDYLGSLVYISNGTRPHLESALFGGGRLEAITNPFQVGGYLYVPRYFLTDHLGSVRVETDENRRPHGRNDYYAFGGRWSDGGAAAPNRWQFNGKEKQDFFDLDLLDYGARMYDAKTGRWLCYDALAEKIMGASPFAFSRNNPLVFVDLDGKLSYRYNWETKEYEDAEGNTVPWNMVSSWLFSGQGAGNSEAREKTVTFGINDGWITVNNGNLFFQRYIGEIKAYEPNIFEKIDDLMSWNPLFKIHYSMVDDAIVTLQSFLMIDTPVRLSGRYVSPKEKLNAGVYSLTNLFMMKDYSKILGIPSKTVNASQFGKIFRGTGKTAATNGGLNIRKYNYVIKNNNDFNSAKNTVDFWFSLATFDYSGYNK